jgi:hypothetical protein
VGFQLSIVRDRTHYVRDGTGGEQLYVLPTDLREQNNIAETVEGAREALGFRELLLETLRESAGSPTVERAYLAECRDWLTALVAEQAAPVSTEGEDDRTEAERLPADTPLPPRADDDGDEDDEG